MADAEVESFLYREAVCMDEHRFDEWLSLWRDPCLYWVPCNDDDIDPKRQVSIIFDDRPRLVQRVERLKSGSVQAMAPLPRLRRLVSNIEVETRPDGDLTARSNFLLYLVRGGGRQIWGGRSIHRLVREPHGLQIAEKKVLLVNNDQEMPLLQFLI